MGAGQPTNLPAANLRRPRAFGTVLMCMGILAFGGVLMTVVHAIAGLSLPPSNPMLLYSGLLAALCGAGALFLTGRRWVRQLYETQARDRAILASIPDGIIVFGRDGKAIAANPAIAALLGRPADTIVGHDIETLMDGVSVADRERLASLVRGGAQPSPGLRLQCRGKTLFVSLAQCCDGFAGSVAVFRDLTHESELDYMKNAFASVASHELRTPLNAILGYTEMLQEGAYGPLLSEQRHAIERIVVNTGQLLDLANNLLDHAQLEAGVLSLSAVPFSPAELVESARGVTDMMARAKGLKLTSHIASDVPATLSGDRQRLYQILVNLIGNAIKFTDEGMVHVRVYKPDATHWALAVSDTGRGIPAEMQPHIFEPFQQIDPLKRNHSGTGLGLSLVKRLVVLMGGEISVESEVGRGSTFIVVLPQ